MNTLHITNGDSTVDLLSAAGIEGETLPWRDILHMGPVPETDTLSELSTIRADFLASLGWGQKQTLRDSFANRDKQLARYDDYDKVIIWVEHDLYDQLQLIQILSWFAGKPKLHKLHLINPGKHLGYHTPEEAKGLLSTEQKVSPEMTDIAQKAWHAYGQSTPKQWFALLSSDTSALPFLQNAIKRSLMELPESNSRVNATEMAILNLVHEGVSNKIEIFRQYTHQETDAFHGDMGFFWYLEQLQLDSPLLLIEQQQNLSLTELGKQVVAGHQRWERQYNQQHWQGGYAIPVINEDA